MNYSEIAESIKLALEKDLPGTDVQWEMASSDRRIEGFPRSRRDNSRLAGVLIILYPINWKIHTLLIQRPVYKGVHSGQIAFPGGKQEESDLNITHTALREACEETGLCREDISILGKLTPLYIPVSDIEVTPVVAFCKNRPDLTPNPDEVVSIIEAELAMFMNPALTKKKAMLIRDEEMEVKYYDLEGKVVWGATAMMLHELLEVLNRNSISLK